MNSRRDRLAVARWLRLSKRSESHSCGAPILFDNLLSTCRQPVCLPTGRVCGRRALRSSLNFEGRQCLDL